MRSHGAEHRRLHWTRPRQTVPRTTYKLFTGHFLASH